MNWTIPGTVLTEPVEEAEDIGQTFRTMFLAGDMVLGQVSGLSGLEPYMIQNWVRRGFLSPPVGKKYTMNQVCRILNINMLRSTLPMEQICGLLTYINGRLDSESDDLIDDAELYFLFVGLAGRARQYRFDESWEAAIDATLESVTERAPGAKARIKKVLQVMLPAWFSSVMRQRAEATLRQMQSGCDERGSEVQPDGQRLQINGDCDFSARFARSK